MTSYSRSLVKEPCGNAPDMAPLRALARPRVECSSSRVTM